MSLHLPKSSYAMTSHLSRSVMTKSLSTSPLNENVTMTKNLTKNSLSANVMTTNCCLPLSRVSLTKSYRW
jgi:hypothetical protein